MHLHHLLALLLWKFCSLAADDHVTDGAKEEDNEAPDEQFFVCQSDWLVSLDSTEENVIAVYVHIRICFVHVELEDALFCKHINGLLQTLFMIRLLPLINQLEYFDIWIAFQGTTVAELNLFT